MTFRRLKASASDSFEHIFLNPLFFFVLFALVVEIVNMGCFRAVFERF